jgi:hypothetical protein
MVSTSEMRRLAAGQFVGREPKAAPPPSDSFG